MELWNSFKPVLENHNIISIINFIEQNIVNGNIKLDNEMKEKYVLIKPYLEKAKTAYKSLPDDQKKQIKDFVFATIYLIMDKLPFPYSTGAKTVLTAAKPFIGGKKHRRTSRTNKRSKSKRSKSKRHKSKQRSKTKNKSK